MTKVNVFQLKKTTKNWFNFRTNFWKLQLHIFLQPVKFIKQMEVGEFGRSVQGQLPSLRKSSQMNELDVRMEVQILSLCIYSKCN